MRQIGTIIEELEKEGLAVADQTKYMRSLMPPVGVMTMRKPTEVEQLDIEFGFTLAKQMGALDIGQTVVVKEQAAMAIEAIEGTDEVDTLCARKRLSEYP